MFFLCIYHFVYHCFDKHSKSLTGVLKQHGVFVDEISMKRVMRLIFSRIFFVCHVVFCYFLGCCFGMLLSIFLHSSPILSTIRWMGCDFALYFGCILGAFVFSMDRDIRKEFL
jgi:hypothetical protein